VLTLFSNGSNNGSTTRSNLYWRRLEDALKKYTGMLKSTISCESTTEHCVKSFQMTETESNFWYPTKLKRMSLLGFIIIHWQPILVQQLQWRGPCSTSTGQDYCNEPESEGVRLYRSTALHLYPCLQGVPNI